MAEGIASPQDLPANHTGALSVWDTVRTAFSAPDPRLTLRSHQAIHFPPGGVFS